MSAPQNRQSPADADSARQGIEPYQRPYRWLMLLLLWLLYLGHGIASRSAAPLVTPMLQDLQMIYSQMGLVLGSWQLSYIAVAVFAGLLLDRWGIRKALFLGVLVIGLSVLLRSLASGFVSLLSAVALFGVGGPMISVGAPKTIAVWFRGKDRGTAVGIYTTGSRVGQMLALAGTNGVVMPLTGYSWRWTFAFYGSCILAAAFLWRLLARDAPTAIDAGKKSFNQLLLNLMRVRNIRIITACGLLTFSINHGFANWLPKLLEMRGMTPAMAGYGAAVPLVASLPSILLIPRLVPAHFRSRFVALLSLLAATAILLIATASCPLPVGLLLFGIAGPTLPPLCMLILMELPEIGPQYMGSVGGVYFTIAEIGGFLGPFAFGVLVDLTGTFLAGAAFLAFLGMIIALLTLILKIPSQDDGRSPA